MGLDMYLSAKRYLPNYDWINQEERDLNQLILQKLGLEGLTDGQSPSSVEVEVRVGYWRKANQIHGWFVDNCQGGEDNCEEYWVSRDKLIELRDLCATILSQVEVEQGQVPNGYSYSPAGKQYLPVEGRVIKNPDVCEDLPPCEGFFFGSDHLGEWYLQDLEHTVKMLTEILDNPVLTKDWDFYYRASW